MREQLKAEYIGFIGFKGTPQKGNFLSVYQNYARLRLHAFRFPAELMSLIFGLRRQSRGQLQ
jgi:hypothetical protein